MPGNLVQQSVLKTCHYELSLGGSIGLDVALVIAVVARADSVSQLMTSDVTAVLTPYHLQHFTHSVHRRAPQKR